MMSNQIHSTVAMETRYVLLKYLAVLTLVISMIACGGGNSPNTNTLGPTAIINGSSLANAGSHWVSTGCAVKVELTSDGGFISAVTDTSGSTTMTSGTWTAIGSDGAATTGSSAWVDGLTNISGSTSSLAFSARVGVYDGYQQNLGTCNFGLQSGGLTFP